MKSPSPTLLPWLISTKINKISAREKKEWALYLLVRASQASFFHPKNNIESKCLRWRHRRRDKEEAENEALKSRLRHWTNSEAVLLERDGGALNVSSLDILRDMKSGERKRGI
jgi:hypothetical protein